MDNSMVEQKLNAYNAQANMVTKNIFFAIYMFFVSIPCAYLYFSDKQTNFVNVELLYSTSIFLFGLTFTCLLISLFTKKVEDVEALKKSTKMIIDKNWFLADRTMFLQTLSFNLCWTFVMYKFGGYYEALSCGMIVLYLIRYKNRVQNFPKKLKIYGEFLK